MSTIPFESPPGVLDVAQLAGTPHLSRAGAYHLLNQAGFPTLRTGGMYRDCVSVALRYPVTKNDSVTGQAFENR